MNWKERWNHITDPRDIWVRSKIFSKEWCVSVLFIVVIFTVLAIIAILCSYFNTDMDNLFNLLIFGGFCFFAGVVFGINRTERNQRESEKQRQMEDAWKILCKWARENPEVCTIYIYGSRAKGDFNKSSDLDIALEIATEQGNIESYTFWVSHGTEYEQELQSLLPYKIHLEYYTQDRKELVKDIVRAAIDIEKSGIVVYSRSEDQKDEQNE